MITFKNTKFLKENNWKLIHKAKEFSFEAHSFYNQTYGDYPYKKH